MTATAGDSGSGSSVEVTVCIANYNGLNIIDACIDSVRAQAGDLAVEIIVHDDASTDGSAAHIRARHPGVRLIESRENAGFCISNNRMAAAARGEYLLLLNNDAALLPDALDTLHEEAVRLGRPAILSLPQYDAESGALLDIGSLLDPFLNAVPNLNRARSDVGMVAGACMWIDTSLWRKLGGFPDWFGSIAEDLYLCCRARLTGYPVRALGTSGYLHRVGASFGGGRAQEGRLVTTFRRRALSERNKTHVMTIAYPGVALLLLPVHLLLLLAEGTALSVLRMSSDYLATIYLPVFGSLIRNRRRLWLERRLVMKQRRIGLTEFFCVFGWMPHKLKMLFRHGLPMLR